MLIIIADSQKLHNTLKDMDLDVVYWNSQISSLYSICDNIEIENDTYLIANNTALSKKSTISCLEEFSNIQIVSQEGLDIGVDTVCMKDVDFNIKISGEYILYINEDNSPQAQQYLLKFLDENCIYNIRVVGPIKVKHYKYLGEVDWKVLLLLIKHSNGCVDYLGQHIYDIAALEKRCITPVKNPLFTETLSLSKIPKDQLPTLKSNLKKALNINDSSE